MKHAGQSKALLKAFLVLCAAVSFWYPRESLSQGPLHGSSQGTEVKPVQQSAQFLGDNACAKCHADKTISHENTGMSKALYTGAASTILQRHEKLKFSSGAYHYSIARRGDRSLYSVSDGAATIEAPILWAFGHGELGQTYVFQLAGKLYESRVSFYSAIENLDITLGAPRTAPVSLLAAAGREMQGADISDCFGCHATNVTSGAGPQFDKLIPGVRCERCHGPGEKHVAAMQAGNLKEKSITNLRTLSTEEQLTFCGACHRTWEQVMLLPGRGGIDNVRFQPYRLTNSSCYDTEDRRISCTACHNPHEEVRREPAFYDAKCTACHSMASSLVQANKRNAPVCPTGKQQCVTCHMPKVEIPGAHFKFTDHYIRVVKPNSPHPI
ncbi:MAG: multiheme c-type cytochrome [Pyrinomonadaceae bacterium]